MTVDVARIERVSCFLDPELEALFREAFGHHTSPAPWETVLSEFAQLPLDQDAGVFVASEGAQWVALAVVFIPRTALSPNGVLWHFYSAPKGKAPRSALLEHVKAFAKQHGCDKLTAVNRNGRDGVFERLVRPDLGPPREEFTTFVFDLE